MKAILVTFVVFFCFVSVTFGQKSSQKTETVKLVESHVGILYGPVYDKDGNISHNIDGRVGGHFKININDATDLNFRTVFVSPGSGFGHFWIEKHYGGTFFAAGFMPRMISENRPSPTSHDGHYEFVGVAAIPGAATGTFIGQKVGSVTLKSGVYYSEAGKSLEYNTGVSCDDIVGFSANIGALYSREYYGVAGTLKNDLVTFTGFWESKQIVSGLCEIDFGIVKPFLTFIYDREKKDFSDDSEFGFTKTFSVNSNLPGLTCLVGSGYFPKTGNIKLYFWTYF
jgi:hypothetical protein